MGFFCPCDVACTTFAGEMYNSSVHANDGAEKSFLFLSLDYLALSYS